MIYLVFLVQFHYLVKCLEITIYTTWASKMPRPVRRCRPGAGSFQEKSPAEVENAQSCWDTEAFDFDPN